MRLALFARGALPALLLVPTASAQSRRQSTPSTQCGAPGRAWIRIDGDALAGFADSLRAEVATEGFDVCAAGGPAGNGGQTSLASGAFAGPLPPPVATIAVTVADASATIEIVDVVTSKRVSRSVDLRSIPADGRDLAVATAADELLRASWAELTIVDAPPPAAPVPEVVHRVVEASVRAPPAAPPPPSGEIGVMLAGETFTGGQTLWGADARARWFVAPHVAATLRLGLRSTLPTQTPEGEVRASALIGGVGIAYRARPSRSVDLDLFARVDAADVTYVAETTVDATASSGSALALLGSAGGAIGWTLARSLHLSAELGVSVPWRPVHATEAGTQVIVGVSGIGGVVGLGAGGLF